MRGEIASVKAGPPMVITLGDTHSLKDQNEVKIRGVCGCPGANGSYFVKSTGFDAKSFAIYKDKKLTEPAVSEGVYEKGGAVYLPFPNDYAIVVGINRYPAFAELNGPETDAQSFRDWLISPFGGMVSSENVKTILSSGYEKGDGTVLDARPALFDLKKEFDRLREQAMKAMSPQYRVGRRLYLFLSGHGITPAGVPSPNLDDAALLMANASSSAYDNHFPGHPYAEYFRNAAAFDEIVLLMDCCRDLRNNVSSIGPSPPLINAERMSSVRRFYAVATELDSSSWEQPLGEPQKPHGVFAYALMEALQSDAVCDSEGKLTGSRLKIHLEQRVKQIRDDQVPRIYPPPDPANDIVFVAQRQVFRPNLIVNFDPALYGQTVQLVDGATYDQPPETHVITAESWKLKKSNGFYRLKIPGGSAQPFPWELDGSQEVMNVKFP